MERLRNISLAKISKDKKVRIAASFLVAGAALGATVQAEGKEPYAYMPTPLEEFHPIQGLGGVKDLTINIPTPSPLVSPMPEVKKLTVEEQKIEDLKTKSNYWLNLAESSGKFSDKQIASLKIYLPIYLAAGEKFDVDWMVLEENHRKESGMSAVGSRAFDGSTYPYVGGMQLNTLIWTPDYIKDAVENKDGKKGKENLTFLIAAFPTRHKGDVEQIVAAAKMIGANEDKSGIRAGFIRFTGSESSGDERYNSYLKKKEIFDEQIRENELREKIILQKK